MFHAIKAVRLKYNCIGVPSQTQPRLIHDKIQLACSSDSVEQNMSVFRVLCMFEYTLHTVVSLVDKQLAIIVMMLVVSVSRYLDLVHTSDFCFTVCVCVIIVLLNLLAAVLFKRFVQ